MFKLSDQFFQHYAAIIGFAEPDSTKVLSIFPNQQADLPESERVFFIRLHSLARLLVAYKRWVDSDGETGDSFRRAWALWQQSPASSHDLWFAMACLRLRHLLNIYPTVEQIGERVPPYVDHVVKLAS